MNRRFFTFSMAALLGAPALPGPAAGAVSGSVVAEHFATAKLLARAHNRCSPAMLQRLLRVDAAVAHELNAALLQRGVITAAGAHGSAMAVNPLNTHCITNEAMRASNTLQKLADAKKRAQKIYKAVSDDPEAAAPPVQEDQGHCTGKMPLS